jgi:thiol-disulfide isomerase/thioredoxin
MKFIKTIVITYTLFTSIGAAAQSVRSFELKDINNSIRSYTELKGEKLTLIDFWATWCKPCNVAIPELNKIYDLYQDKGVAIIGVNCDGPRSVSKVAPFSKSKQIQYPVLIDINSELLKDFNVTGFPTLIVVDANDKVVWVHEGFVAGDTELIIAEIEKLLITHNNE